MPFDADQCAISHQSDPLQKAKIKEERHAYPDRHSGIRALIFFISGAHATDNGQWKGYQLTPYQQNWFSTVTVPKSDLICCTIADGYPVTAEPRGNHFWINYKGHWYQVPDAVVIRDHINPIGVPIAWLKLVGDYVTGIRCFLPADQT
jgi:hypothetical protein